MEASAFAISYLSSDGAHHCPLNEVGQLSVEDCLPVRRFPAHRKQRHMPGFYWFATSGRHVPYESRLEMAVLIGLDFDQDVGAVSAQPFRLEYGNGSVPRHHVPDFLVALRSGLRRVVDVKPAEHSTGQRAEEIFGLTRRACEQVGWDYVVATEPEPTALANLSWLAGHRRRPADPHGLAPLIIESCNRPTTLGDLLGTIGPAALVRPVLFHLLWSQALTFDLAQRLASASVLRRSPHRDHAA